MNRRGQTIWRDERFADACRWTGSFLLVLAASAGTVITMRDHVFVSAPVQAAPEAILLDLAPAEPPAPAPPPVPRAEPEPRPQTNEVQEQPTAPPPPEPPPQAAAQVPPEVALPLPPPPPPPPPPRVPRPARPAPRPARAPTPPSAAPVQSQAAQEASNPPAHPSAAPTAAPYSTPDAVPRWQAQLAQCLAQFKRYPPRARLRGVQGVALLRFSIDRTGHVLSASLVRSAGSDELDQETLALIRRADPLPPPPPGVPGNPVVLTVPIRFSLR